MSIWTIIIAVLMFGVLILVHEFGHFIVAKLSGMIVHEFSLGMGPVIFKKKKGETQYSIRAFPVGGFVMVEGEDGKTELEDGQPVQSNPRAFGNIKLWKRIVFVIAGAIMNLLLGFILLIVLVSMQDLIGTTTVIRFNENAVSSSHLMENDKILKVNGSAVFSQNDIIYSMVRDKDCVIDFTVERNGEKTEVLGVPFESNILSDGTQAIVLDFKILGVPKTFFGVIKEAFFWTTAIVRQVWGALTDLITGQFAVNQLSGPIGVTSAINQTISVPQFDIKPLLLMIAFITVNLGVFNLLPFPALDGGRLVFLIIEAFRGKPIPQKYEGYVHAAGFALLICLMVYVTFNDIIKFF